MPVKSITHADQSGDAFRRMGTRTTAADALHQSGQHMESRHALGRTNGCSRQDKSETLGEEKVMT